MADQRTMAQLLELPTECYEDAIVVPGHVLEHSAHVEDIVASETAIARIFLYPEQFLLVFDSSAIFLAVASLYFWQLEPSSLAVRSSSGSRNFIAGSGNALCIFFPTGKWKKHKLNRRIQNVWELQGRSDLVEISNMSMWVFFVMSKELLVLNKSKETMLELKFINSDLNHIYSLFSP
nr:hypothetical protein [Tanacetum cinerariifolium]